MVDKLITVRLESQQGSFRLTIDFSVPEGLIVLFGPSGCGKSTTLDCIAGLRQPASGLVEIAGVKFYDSAGAVDLAPQLRKVGYVFQRCALFPHLNVRSNICFGISRRSVAEQEQKLTSLLELLELEALAERKIDELSGGQIQRVALARALAPDPKVLLLDEPFTALDFELRTQLGNELKSLQRRLGLPMIMVTHSRSEALALSDVVVNIKDGKVQACGTPEEILVM